jgi:hypothetical protein
VLVAVAPRLVHGGHFLFTMPNRNSLNRYSRYPIPSYTTSTNEIADACFQAGLRVVDIRSFSKIPTRFYLLSSGPGWRDLMLKAEMKLEAGLGAERFGRELFVVAERQPGSP